MNFILNNQDIWKNGNSSLEELMEIIYSISTLGVTNKTLVNEFFARISDNENLDRISDK